jgi:hypothetical protein
MFINITLGESQAHPERWVTLELDVDQLALPWPQLSERYIKPAFKQLLLGHLDEDMQKYLRARDHFEGHSEWPSRASIVKNLSA